MRTGKRGKGRAAGTIGSKPKSSGKVVPLGTSGKTKSKQSKAAPKARSARPTTGPTHEQIAQRAEAIWHKRGRPTGQDEQNWHEAEAQLRAELGID